MADSAALEPRPAAEAVGHVAFGAPVRAPDAARVIRYGPAELSDSDSPAYSVLDSYIYGFALTKMNLPFETAEDVAEVGQTMLEPFPLDEYPNLVEFITQHALTPSYDYGDEFEYGLDLILDGLAAARGRE